MIGRPRPRFGMIGFYATSLMAFVRLMVFVREKVCS
jgi:hypothetical protein